MDQSAFRALLATPRPGGSASASASTSAGDSWRGGHGSEGSRKPKSSKPAFKPRSEKKDGGKDGAGKDGKEKKEPRVLPPGYRDRAAERRLGQEHEFSAAEKMLEDFTAKSAGLDRAAVEEQRAFLGGDAEHSIAVKGLDMSLLASERAKLDREAEPDAERALEDAFEGTARSPSPPPVAARSRDDILRDLLAKNASTSAAEADALLKAKAEGKFRRVGEKPAAAAKKDAAGVKVATITLPDGTVKKLRKKKKLAPVVEPVASTSSAPSPPPAAVVKPEPARVPSPPPAAPAPAEVDDLDDLFGGTVAPYVRPTYDDDSGSEGEIKPSVLAPAPASRATAGVKPKLFDDDDADLRAEPISAPELPKLPPPSKGKGKARAMDDGEDGEQPMKLQPLASTAVSDIRALLDLDAAQEKLEQKRERKQARKLEEEGGMPGDPPPKKRKGPMTAKDKLNRDFQAYEQYEAKQKRKREGRGSPSPEARDDRNL